MISTFGTRLTRDQTGVPSFLQTSLTINSYEKACAFNANEILNRVMSGVCFARLTRNAHCGVSELKPVAGNGIRSHGDACCGAASEKGDIAFQCELANQLQTMPDDPLRELLPSATSWL